jgi:uncharacterized protein YmfQ (DUF2313 family)
MQMKTINSIKQILFFILDFLDDDLQCALSVIGDLFDDIDSKIDLILSEIEISNSAETGLLPDYERYYHVPPRTGDTVEIRRNRVVAAFRAKGGFNRLRFKTVAHGFGYSAENADKSISFTDGQFNPFRADISQADIDAVYDGAAGESQYTIEVSGTDVESDVDLQSALNRLRAAGTELIFSNE